MAEAAAAAGPRKRRRVPCLPVAHEWPNGPGSLQELLDFAKEAATCVLSCPARRARLELVLKRTIVTDTVFTGRGCFEDSVRIFLFAAADILQVPRPQIIHHSGCDHDDVALAVLKQRKPAWAHCKLFSKAEGRLSASAAKRAARLLPDAGLSAAEAAERYKAFFRVLLRKPQIFFPQHAEDTNVLTGRKVRCRWQPHHDRHGTGAQCLILNQGSTPCTGFSRRASRQIEGAGHSTMVCTYVSLAEQNGVLGQSIPAVSFHENLKNFHWSETAGALNNVTEARRVIIGPEHCGVPARRDRGLGMMMGNSMCWFGAADHELEFQNLFGKALRLDSSVWMVDTPEHVQDLSMFVL